MDRSAVYRPHAEEPAEARLSPLDALGAWAGLHAQRFELVSRGDFVPGLLYQPPSPSPRSRPERDTSPSAPLLLVQHDARESKQSPSLEFLAAWVGEGLHVAAIDLPLHGERSSPKLSERLCLAFERIARGESLDAESRALAEEFARQATSDLVRSLDALSALPEIDADRIAFLGFGLGAIVGSYLLAIDPRPRAAVLARVGGGMGPSEFDPATWLARTSNVASLIIASKDDARTPESTARALFEAAPEPRRFVLCGDSRTSGPGDEAVIEIESFVRDALRF